MGEPKYETPEAGERAIQDALALADSLGIERADIARCLAVDEDALGDLQRSEWGDVLHAIATARQLGFRDNSVCMPTKPRVTLCRTMVERLNEFSRGKGLRHLQYSNMETGKFTRSLVVYATSAKDNGLVLNRCPWCGGQLYRDEEVQDG